jgi:hypothetical protein
MVAQMTGWLHLFPFLRELKNRRRPQTSKKAATTPATVRATAALSMSTMAEAELALSTPLDNPESVCKADLDMKFSIKRSFV